MIEIEEVLYQWLKGVSIKGICRSLNISRNTVRKAIAQAQELGLSLQSRTEEIEELRSLLSAGTNNSKPASFRAPAQHYLATHHQQIEQWYQLPYMTAVQMVRLFREQDIRISETSLRRYIAQHFPPLPKSTVHLETVPGRQAQVDFCAAGMMIDPLTQKLRKAYGFVMSLSHSRHRFVRFVFSQDVATWIDCHIRAFHFFGGVPDTVMLDNLKAGVIKADIYDPVINRSYAELERHYGFVCDPNKIRTPQHKGKVERSMTLVRQQVLAGRNFKDIEEANKAALHWCRHEISQRVTRTTGQKPWDLFESQEKPMLRALPTVDYELSIWQELKVHRDHHVVFDGSYYSVPTQYIGQNVWLRATKRIVDIYVHAQKIKTHVRAQVRGKWVTDQQDYPVSKRAFLSQDKKHCLQQAVLIGPYTTQFLKIILKGSTMHGQRTAQAVLRLASEYSEPRLEAACQHCLSFDNYAYRSLQKTLKYGYEQQELPVAPVFLSQQTSYVRPNHAFTPLQGDRL